MWLTTRRKPPGSNKLIARRARRHVPHPEPFEARVLLSSGSYTYAPVVFPGSSTTELAGINNSGEVVGSFTGTSLAGGSFLLSNGSYTTIAVPASTGFQTMATAISSSGQIVGDYNDTTTFAAHGFLQSGGTFTTIDAPGSSGTYLNAINGAGAVLGTETVSGQADSFLSSGGSYTTINFPGAAYTGATAISDPGLVVGNYSNSNDTVTHGFLLSGGTYTTIDVPGADFTWPTGINSSGQVAGYYHNADNALHGFVYSNGTFTTIDYPGAVQTTINGINDSGQLAITTYDPGLDGNPSGSYVATPAASSATIAAGAPSLATDGGVDYGYTISQADLSAATTVALYWASGTDIGTEIGAPIVTTTTDTAQGTHSLHAGSSALGTRPAGATELLVVVDPQNQVSPADPTKVAGLPLQAATTTTTLASSANPSTFGQSVTFTATVQGIASAGGSVTFTIDGSDQPAVALQAVDGHLEATLSTTSLAVGAHAISARYSGDLESVASTAQTVTQQVGRASSKTVLAVSPRPGTAHQSITLTATVTGAANPTGAVTYFDGKVKIGMAPLVAGSNGVMTAVLRLPFSAGTHTLQAVYSGDAEFDGGNSNTVSEVTAADGPRVLGVSRSRSSGALVVAFDESLAQASASNRRNYELVATSGAGSNGKVIAINLVRYTPGSRIVTIIPAQSLSPNASYSLVVIGASPTGVADTAGRRLDGKGNGTPGSNFVKSFVYKTLPTTT